ncbi:adenylyl cyclase [Sanguibacter antarcticus]|uniref:Pectate lyase-like protein n=1 Tax=Sanguibacter antarcticus TaxID=372484 RepID=A0A2A9E9M3_9MICO|nr:adenylyl cyclase [Sanguibacter antarcticus]PFG34919.1 hypothetical protein ATL42_2850 [Sanguibacter antarcticus]
MSPARPRRRGRLSLTVAAVATAALVTSGAAAAGPVAPAVADVSASSTFSAGRSTPSVDLGENVIVFDESMATADIESQANAIADAQVDNEMGTARWSLLFKPGTYGTAADPLQIRVGYYTEVAGLGASPADVVINGKIESYNRCLTADNCIALNTFWRSLSNLTLDISAEGQDGCRGTANFWAVSQAVSVRRLDVRADEGDPTFSLMDYCTNGPQYASGGFIADSRFGTVVNGSQQQWLTRNSVVDEWSNGVWNQVFSGVEGAPDDAGFPDPTYTTVDNTPVSREKPYLFVDSRGAYKVRVPQAQTESRGISWADGTTAGRSISLSDFYVASPGDSVKTINSQLARGKNLLLTPGVYDVDSSITVKRANTVVLGMGQATLTAVGGSTPLVVSDVPGIVVAGVTIDAGTEKSDVLLQVGSVRNGNGNGNSSSSWLRKITTPNPITLSDVYFRVGGPHVGKTDTAMRIDADGVLIDHTWVWRADHGVEGFTDGVNGDTDRWNTNTGTTGVVVTGDDVTATGLFVEHFQQRNLLWEGERGTVILFQNELPYDPPTQADWTQPDGTLGWPGYTVAADVETHTLFGAGVYVFNQNNPDIVTASGFSVPSTPGVQLNHVMTVNLNAGTVQHVVNDTGAQVDSSAPGVPSFVTVYPEP